MPSEVNSPTIRAALYARVSSDLQSAASVDDQLRICAEWAAKEGWQVVERYFDQVVSGASLIRPGIQKLLQDAAAGKFDIISPSPSIGCPATRRTSPASTSGCASGASGSSPCPIAR
jgi:Resolvase, N terminal domain